MVDFPAPAVLGNYDKWGPGRNSARGRTAAAQHRAVRRDSSRPRRAVGLTAEGHGVRTGSQVAEKLSTRIPIGDMESCSFRHNLF